MVVRTDRKTKAEAYNTMRSTLSRQTRSSAKQAMPLRRVSTTRGVLVGQRFDLKKFNVGDLVRSDDDGDSYIIYRVVKKLTRNEYGYDVRIKSVLVIDGSMPFGYDSTECFSDNLVSVTLVELCMIRAKLDEFIQAEVKFKSGGPPPQEKVDEPKTRHRTPKDGKQKTEGRKQKVESV